MLKVYRKFLILFVMLGCLYVVGQGNKVAAVPCCSQCDGVYFACQDYCESDQIKDWMRPACHANCDNNYNNCMSNCNMNC